MRNERIAKQTQNMHGKRNEKHENPQNLMMDDRDVFAHTAAANSEESRELRRAENIFPRPRHTLKSHIATLSFLFNFAVPETPATKAIAKYPQGRRVRYPSWV